MDFFQAQDDARERTRRLLVYYCIAVLLIFAAVYLAVTAGFFLFEWQTKHPVVFQTPVFARQRLGVTVGCTVGVTLFAALYKRAELRGGGPAVCAALAAREVEMGTRNKHERKLIGVVQEMAIASGLPMPRVYVLANESSINAFAAGFTVNDSAVVVTHGALIELDRDELQAVVAHEFSHILNGDMRLNLLLVSALHGILALTIFARILRRAFFPDPPREQYQPECDPSSWRWRLRMRFGRRSKESKFKWKGSADLPIVTAVLVVIVLVTIIGFIGAFFARLIQAAVARSREVLADASAVQFTRNPAALAGALRRVGGHDSLVSAPSAPALAHCFFANATQGFWAQRLETHPPIEQRVLAVDPTWDGAMLSRRVPEPTDEERATQAALSAMVGLLRAPQLDYARDLIRRIPKEVGDALLEPSGAEALVYVLLLHRDAETRAGQWRELEASVDGEVLTSMQILTSRMQELTPAWRLPLLELAIATLRTAPVGVLQRLETRIDAMILADQRVELFEFVLRRIVHDRLLPSRDERAHDPLTEPRPSPRELREAAACVLSSVVSTALRDPEWAAAVVARVSNTAGYAPQLPFMTGLDGRFELVNHALDVFRRATYADRKQLLLACERGILDDRQVSLEESELFRAIAGAMDVPVPPAPEASR